MSPIDKMMAADAKIKIQGLIEHSCSIKPRNWGYITARRDSDSITQWLSRMAKTKQELRAESKRIQEFIERNQEYDLAVGTAEEYLCTRSYHVARIDELLKWVKKNKGLY